MLNQAPKAPFLWPRCADASTNRLAVRLCDVPRRRGCRGRCRLPQHDLGRPAGLHGAEGLSAAGDDARPRRRRHAARRIRPRAAHLPADRDHPAAGGRGVPLGRGQGLLHPPRHRLRRRHPRRARQRHAADRGRLGAAGRRVDDHPAGGEELPPELGADLGPQDRRGDPRAADRVDLLARTRSSSSTSTRSISARSAARPMASRRRRSTISTRRSTS